MLTNSVHGIGPSTIVVNTPQDAVLGNTYLRLRISSEELSGSETYKGSAADGEVEDHVVAIQGEDFGDAPNSYFTQYVSNTSGGPFHPIIAGATVLGPSIDPEGNGVPTTGADGDDAANNDDEDGVTGLPLVVTPAGGPFSYNIAVSTAAADVYAWADFGQDGVFNPFTDEILGQFAGGENHPIGSTAHNLVIPPTVSVGPLYLRFRAVNDGHAALTFAHQQSVAANGEVEDYLITVVNTLQDWGDAPDSYATTAGPNHDQGGPQFGAEWDAEAAGFPSSGADGDDLSQSPDDEDGITLPSSFLKGTDASVAIDVQGQTGQINAFIDWNRDGDFTDSGEQVLTDVSQGVSTVNYNISVPSTAIAGTTYARFRISTAGGDSHSGNAASGEVEDYQITVEENLDFGDAPDSYCTLLASEGPRHLATGPFLGTLRDTETDAVAVLAGADADGDDSDGTDDEDGVTFSPTLGFDLNTATSNSISYTIGDGPADVEIFIDWDRDGTFATSERLDFDSQATGPHSQSIVIPSGATAGDTYVRVRVYAPGDSLNSEKGSSTSGEVEDYRITLINTTWVDLLSFDAAPRDNGQVAISWVTGAEIDTAGFNIKRGQISGKSASTSYQTERINSSLIPSLGSSVEGASYEYFDNPGYGTFYYQLEDLEVSGRSSLHSIKIVTILPSLKIYRHDSSFVRLGYETLPGYDYEVQYRSLSDPATPWQPLPGESINGGVYDETTQEVSARLYRLVAIPKD